MTTYMFCNEVVVFGDCYLVFGVTGLRVLHGVGVVCHRLDSTCLFAQDAHFGRYCLSFLSQCDLVVMDVLCTMYSLLI